MLSLSHRRLNPYEVGSLVPSLARSRFQDYEILDPLCRDYALGISKDVSKTLHEPKYLKIFLERLISLNYHKQDQFKTETNENASIFFRQLSELIEKKRFELETALYEATQNGDPQIEEVRTKLETLMICD